MRNHAGCQRKFYQLSRAWYAKTALQHEDVAERFNIGFYHPKGGTSGEFQMVWVELNGRLTPQLCAYSDSWGALSHFQDLLTALAEVDSYDLSPTEFTRMLIDLGIEDATPESQDEI